MTSGKKILIVDDDRHHLAIVGKLLHAHGYRVATAETSVEAVHRNFDFRPDLVILDIMMPGYDGYSACMAMRELEPGLPIVILSAKDAPADVREGLDWGATRYLTKPFDPDELVLIVNSFLEPKGS
jgi:DNA-binding response OmpR family regulator